MQNEENVSARGQTVNNTTARRGCSSICLTAAPITRLNTLDSSTLGFNTDAARGSFLEKVLTCEMSLCCPLAVSDSSHTTIYKHFVSWPFGFVITGHIFSGDSDESSETMNIMSVCIVMMVPPWSLVHKGA